MRIGIMARPYDEKGGIGVYTRNIIRQLLEIDRKNQYFIYYKNPALIGSLRDYPNVTERHVRAPNKLLWDQVAIPRAAKRDRIDLIFHSKFTVPLFASAKRIMVVHGADTMMDEYAKEYRCRDVIYNRAVRPWYFRACAKVLSISNYSTEGFVRAIPRYKDRLVTSYFGPHAAFHPIHDREKLEAVRQRYQLPEKFILTVIRYDPGTPNTRKNAGNMLKAFALLKKSYGIEHKLVVVGKECHRYGEDYRIHELGIAGDVVFPGLVAQEDLPAFYNLAALYLYPTIIEAFPIPITEAMACRTPIVTSHGTGLEELAGDAALKVNPLNPAEIAEAANRVLTEPELARQMVERGFERSKLFSWEKCAHQTLRVFEEVLTGSNAAACTDEVNLRICYLLESFWPVIGGGESTGRLLCEAFARQGAQVNVVTRHMMPGTPRHEILFGAKVHRIGPSGGTLGSRRWSMIPTAFYWLLRKRKEWDIVLADGFRSLGIPAVIAAKLLGKKAVLKPQNIGEISGRFFDGKLRRLNLTHSHWLVRPFIALLKAIHRNADAFCAISEDIRQEFLSSGVSASRLHLICNPYDAKRFHPSAEAEKRALRQNLGIPEDALVGIFTGRLVSWKGPQLLVSMWHEIAAQDGNSILLVAGPDGHEAADCSGEIRDYIRNHRLEGKIRMPGGVFNVQDYLRAADYFAYPSQGGEGCSLGTIEAMACGLPIVTTSATGMLDVVGRNTALVVAPHDLAGFKRAMRTLMNDKELRTRLGQAGAARAREIFASEIVASEYLDVMQGLARSARLRERRRPSWRLGGLRGSHSLAPIRTWKPDPEHTPLTDPSAALLAPTVSTANSAHRIGARSRHADYPYRPHELKALRRAGERLFRMSLTVGALLAWLFAVVLPAIRIHVLGFKLSSDQYALPAVAIFALLMSITVPSQRLLSAAKLQGLQVKFMFTGIFTTLALGVSLIHKFGINGILAAILAGEIVVAALSLRALAVRHLSPFLWRLGGPLLGSLAAALSAGVIFHHDSARPAWVALGSLAAMCLVWLATDFIPVKHHK